MAEYAFSATSLIQRETKRQRQKRMVEISNPLLVKQPILQNDCSFSKTSLYEEECPGCLFFVISVN